jgi:FkbM family methyltransferase
VPLVSYAQNGEDVRLWRAFRDLSASDDRLDFTYVDVGANYPWELSITASLYVLGWRGLLVEADPDLAAELRLARPGDQVAEVAAGPGQPHGRAIEQTAAFYRVPGTGLGTLDSDEAEVARSRGFDVIEQTVRTESLDQLLSQFIGDTGREIHFMSIDVEGAEAQVLAGLSLSQYRPWVLCIEAVESIDGTWPPNAQN